jgi:cell division protein FtsI/penicillin-binding protein 2
MRDAVRYGGITGDGFWHNSVKLPQVNSDMILGTTFFYFGLFGYCILFLIVALIVQIGRMLRQKSLSTDQQRALRFINFGFVVFVVIAIPALWLLGAISLNLPLTGVVFPFLARGNYFQGCLGVLLALLIFFDIHSSTDQAKPRTGAIVERLKDWLCEPLPLMRMIKWTMVGLTVLALGYGYSFAKLVHFPVLAGSEGDKKYIVIPDNDTQEIRLDITKDSKENPPGINGERNHYRIGNTIVNVEIPATSENSYSDSFVYISEYSFNRDEASEGITIGKSGQFSPILALPGLSPYAHKRNDIILFWENLKELAHLTLKPENNKIRLSLSPDNAADKSVTAKVFKSINQDAKLDKDKWEEISRDALLESDPLVKVGSTIMKIQVHKENAAQFLSIILEPDRPARASFLRSKQGEDFILSRSKVNVIGGLQLAVKNIEAARLSKTPWGSRFENQIAERAAILDRSGELLMDYDSSRGGAWYADQNLFYTIGTSQPVKAGLDYVLDPILSGKKNTDAFHSLLSTTNRSIHKDKVPGENVLLSYDINIQRALTEALNSLLKGKDIRSASAVILNGNNEILGTAQSTTQAKQKFKFEKEGERVFLRFDEDFLNVWANIDARPPEALLYANPLLRRPLCDAFKTELIGSTIKGILYTAALADARDNRSSHFHFGSSLETSYVSGMKGDKVNTSDADDPNGRGVDGGSIGDKVNTRDADDPTIFTADQELVPFGEYQFNRVHNSHEAVIKTNLYDAFRHSSNTTSCYLALRLQQVDRLEFALKRFMFDTYLLLQSEDFENRLNPSQYLKAEVTRYADDFKWGNASDALRIGIGDKIYISLLHLATFYSTILVNDGMFIHPAIVIKIGEKNLDKVQYPLLNQDDRKFVIPKMQQLARAVLSEGTGKAFARQLANSGIEFVGGKTGTASLPEGSEQEHKIFVVCIKIKGKPFTIACRVNYAPTGTDLAVDLAAKVVKNALLTTNSSN